MTQSFQETRVLLVHAEDTPEPGRADPAPHQRYRLPRSAIATRRMGELADDKIRVQMNYAGICGTDLHLLQTVPATGYVRTSAPASIPQEGRIIGHEGVGRVIGVGGGVKRLHPGNIVAFASIISCMQCDACRRGAFNQCEDGGF